MTGENKARQRYDELALILPTTRKAAAFVALSVSILVMLSELELVLAPTHGGQIHKIRQSR